MSEQETEFSVFFLHNLASANYWISLTVGVLGVDLIVVLSVKLDTANDDTQKKTFASNEIGIRM